jgi:uncharacterized membrane protein (UPF0127 family)
MNALTVVIAMVIGVSAAAAAILYFYPAITTMLYGQEDEPQEVIIGEEETTPGSNGYGQVNVAVNDFVLVADVSASNIQKTKGLSVKDDLAENEAMLFVFDKEAQHTFWMKDMKFPIDIIWIDSNKTVVHIEHNLQPCSSELLCPTYKPTDDSLYVLETIGGFAKKHDIVEGTTVKFELKA